MSPVDQSQQPVIARTIKILGIRFFTGSLGEATERAMRGGLVIVPSAPGLAMDLVESQAYRDAITSAELVLVDSSALVLFWFALSGQRLNRTSGLMFLREVLSQDGLRKKGTIFWVMPSDEESRRNLAWLQEQGFQTSDEDVYVAPHYSPGAIGDDVLLSRIELRQPKIVVLAIGGGVQERLGHYLSQHLKGRPAILCTGAAIAFLSGGQAKIPKWADALMLAWLVRIIYSPRRYAKRYWKAWALFPLIWSNRENMPPIHGMSVASGAGGKDFRS